jgi:F-type H+-transporting ATPase subunit epsilon
VEVVSPERILWTGEAQMVTARTIDGGEIAFMTGHAPFVGALDIGKVSVRPEEGNGPDQLIAVHGGFVEVSHDRVTILSDVAELPEQIDIARARAALERAQTETKTGDDTSDAAAALLRATLRLEVAGDKAALGASH